MFGQQMPSGGSPMLSANLPFAQALQPTSNIIPAGFGQSSCPIPIINNIPSPTTSQSAVSAKSTMITGKEIRENEAAVIESLNSLPQVDIIGLTHCALDNDPDSVNYIRRYAVVEITSHEEHGPRTVNDPAMGPDINGKCQTCSNTFKNCLGHKGVITMKRPFINPQTTKMLGAFLESICWDCLRPYLSESNLSAKGIDKLHGGAKLRAIAEESKNMTCQRGDPNCERVSRSIKSQDLLKNRVNYTIGQASANTGGELEIGPVSGRQNTLLKILSAFGKEHPEDLKFLGFDYGVIPRAYLIEAVLVFPPCNRLSAKIDGRENQDQITGLYRDLVKANNAVAAANSDDARAKLQAKVISKYRDIVDGSTSAFSGGKIVGIGGRTGGKSGQLRHELQGKCIWNVGRTVLTGDPDLKAGTVGVPKFLAEKLPIPIFIVSTNIAEMTQKLRDGLVLYIKSKSGPRKGNRVVVRDSIRDNYKPQIGDILYRQLEDGDPVGFNRQPTLHKHSIQGFYAVIVPDKTIHLKPSAVSGPNADFDGDEGSIHVPQSTEAMYELATIMHYNNCMLTESSNSAYGLIMDNVSGMYLLSRPGTMINEMVYYDILSSIIGPQLATLDERLEKFGIKKFSGQALISAILPEDLYYKKGQVLIIDGILIKGVITKSHVGNGDRTIPKSLALRDSQLAADFMTNGEMITNRYLEIHPITMSLSDCLITDKKQQAYITREKNKSEMEINVLEESLKSATDPGEKYRIELMIKSKADTVKALGQKVVGEFIGPDNNLGIAINSGAKGSTFNAAQISTGLSQIFVSGERPEALSIFFGKQDSAAAARGYVSSSYGGRPDKFGMIHGLRPADIIFQGMGSREGLAGTSLKTQIVGEITRVLRRILENAIYTSDGTIRYGSNEKIIQYGSVFNPARTSNISTSADVKSPSFIIISDTVGELNAKFGYTEVPGYEVIDTEVSMTEMRQQYELIQKLNQTNSSNQATLIPS